jgi:hypothetical protein
VGLASLVGTGRWSALFFSSRSSLLFLALRSQFFVPPGQ